MTDSSMRVGRLARRIANIVTQNYGFWCQQCLTPFGKKWSVDSRYKTRPLMDVYGESEQSRIVA